MATVAPLGTPDSPVNYSGERPQKPEGEEFSVRSPGAPDMSGALNQGTLGYPFALLLNPILGLFIG